jgi:hypothetical protein
MGLSEAVVMCDRAVGWVGTGNGIYPGVEALCARYGWAYF